MKCNSVRCKRVGECAKERVVSAVSFVGDEVVIESFDALPVGPMSPPDAGLINKRLVELSGHRGLLDAVATEISNHTSESAPAKPFEVLANTAERGVGQVGSSGARNVIILSAKCFGHEHGIPSPRGEQADAFGRA